MPQDNGIRIGTNADTNTDFQVKFTTKYSTLKLLKWGNAKLVTDGSGDGSVDVYHGLGYAPIVVVFRKFTAQYTLLSSTTYANCFYDANSINAYVTDGTFDYYADKEKIHIFGPSVGGISNGSRTPNKEYEFRYMIFVDPSELFGSQPNAPLNRNFGFKSAKIGKNVLIAREFEMNYSSKYRALQYFENHIEGASLTLPAMQATTYDPVADEATYVDFEHNLGYPPFFMVFSDLGGSSIYEVPYLEVGTPVSSSYEGYEEVSAWCNSERVRVLFHRQSSTVSDDYGQSYSAKTINIYVIIFAENLLSQGNS